MATAERNRLKRLLPRWSLGSVGTSNGLRGDRLPTLLGCLPELGGLWRKEVAALVGVAPFNRDGGRWRGKRGIWGGRAVVRAGLYTATSAAAKWNPVIRGFYLRLIRAGKTVKAALVACMRKLLVILNAIVRDGRPWRYSPASP